MTLVAALPLLAAAMLLAAPRARGPDPEPGEDWPAAWEWIWLLPAVLALLAGGG